MPNDRGKRIFISALEHSAELHCANLIGAVADKQAASGDVWPGQEHIPVGGLAPAVEWVGFGGEKMQQRGCRLLDHTVKRAAMIYNVFGQLGYYRKLIQQANDYFAAHKVDLAVVCDSPAFNFHIAKAAKKYGIPVLFYVAPQLWAWAPWRIHKLKRCCDRLACILPFEKDWFGARGMAAEFVSNPLFDTVDVHPEEHVKSYSDYDPAAPKIALLPGSREAEIRSLWPAMLEIAAELRHKHPGAVFSACAPDADKLALLEEIAGVYANGSMPIYYHVSTLVDLARQSDLAFVASGSATLQVAAAGCPMVVMYQSSRLMWHLVGRWLIRTRFLSLPNILAGRELVPEFMPYFTDLDPIRREAESLLCNRSKLMQTSSALVELVRPLTERRACDVVAEMVLAQLNQST